MGTWLGARPLVLASKSKVRHLILTHAGIPHIVVPADIDERAIERQAVDGVEAAILLAREKALAVGARNPDAVVLGADQTLLLGQQRFSKPKSRSAAREQLTALCGRTHELHSAVAVARGKSLAFEHCDVARLTMRAFSESFLQAYLAAAGNAVTASVGAYQLERFGIQLFEHIDGDYFTILGLPLLPLLQFLRREGLLME
jgi:septum formation protein